jgi:hypothetical protein
MYCFFCEFVITNCYSVGEEGNGDGRRGEEEVLPPHPGHEEAVAAGEAESARRHGRNLLQGGAQAQGSFKRVLKRRASFKGNFKSGIGCNVKYCTEI